MTEKSLKDTELYEERFGFKERNSVFRYLIVLLAIFLLIFGVRIYFTQAFGGVVVDGESMNNTLADGQRLLMRPTSEKYKADYGDVIVVYVGDYEEFQGKNEPDYLIKRLIAKGSDKVYCTDGQVYVQYGGEGEFVPLNEPYAYYRNGKLNYNFPLYEVGEDEVFFLGDNRQNSMDSRYPTYSKLKDKLYKEEDICGVVPDWAIEYDGVLNFFFFPTNK